MRNYLSYSLLLLSFILFARLAFAQGALDELEKAIDDAPPKSALDELEGTLDDVLPSRPLPAPKPRTSDDGVDDEDDAALPGFLGLFTDDRSTTADGIPVVNVTPDGPAETAGVRVGDRIRFVNESPVAANDDIAELLRGAKAGDIVTLNLTRGREVMTVRVVLGVRGETPLRAEPRPLDSTLRPADRATLGVSVSPVDPSRPGRLAVSQGAFITGLQPGSPARNAGFEAGDVIVAVDGRRIDSPADLVNCIAMTRPGETIDVSHYRGVRLYRRSVKMTWTDPAVATAPTISPGGIPEDRPVLRMLEGVLGRVAPGAVPPLSELIPPRNTTPPSVDPPPVLIPTPAPTPAASRDEELARLKVEMGALQTQMERIQNRISELEDDR